MLKIRKQQIEVLSQAAVRDFEDRMVAQLKKFFPEKSKQLGEPGVREAIQYGIRRAAAYGIVVERDVCLYIDVMFFFGRDFDRDANLPWAGRVLKDKSFSDATAKTNRLYELAQGQASGGVR